MSRYTPRQDSTISIESFATLTSELTRGIDEIVLLNTLKTNLESIHHREMTALESTAVRMAIGAVILNKTSLSLAMECINVSDHLNTTVSLESVGEMLNKGVKWLKDLYLKVFNPVKKKAQECRETAKSVNRMGDMSTYNDATRNNANFDVPAGLEPAEGIIIPTNLMLVNDSFELREYAELPSRLDSITSVVYKTSNFNRNDLYNVYEQLKFKRKRLFPMDVNITGGENPRAKFTMLTNEETYECKVRWGDVKELYIKLADGLDTIHTVTSAIQNKETNILSRVNQLEKDFSHNKDALNELDDLKTWLGLTNDVLTGYYVITQSHMRLASTLFSLTNKKK